MVGRIGRIGRDATSRIARRLPDQFSGDAEVLIVPCERRQGLAIAGDALAWVGVAADGRRDLRASARTASIGDITRVLWNRIDILDRQELTVVLSNGTEVTVAPLDPGVWGSIRPRLEGSQEWPAWPNATVGERLGGFLPANISAGRSSIVYVDSDRISHQGREYLVDAGLRARFGYRPGSTSAAGLLRGYGLQDLFTRRSPSGMEPYVHLSGDDWHIEVAITARDPSYVSNLVDRINDLGQRFGSTTPMP